MYSGGKATVLWTEYTRVFVGIIKQGDWNCFYCELTYSRTCYLSLNYYMWDKLIPGNGNWWGYISALSKSYGIRSIRWQYKGSLPGETPVTLYGTRYRELPCNGGYGISIAWWRGLLNDRLKGFCCTPQIEVKTNWLVYTMTAWKVYRSFISILTEYISYAILHRISGVLKCEVYTKM